MIDKSPYQLTKPAIKADPEEDWEKGHLEPVFDIITNVKVRDVVATGSAHTATTAMPANEDVKHLEGYEANSSGSTAMRKTYKIQSVDDSRMVINSKPLIEAIRATVSYYPTQLLDGDIICVPEPYHMLVQYQEELHRFFNQHATSLDMSEDKFKGAEDLKVHQTFLNAI